MKQLQKQFHNKSSEWKYIERKTKKYAYIKNKNDVDDKFWRRFKHFLCSTHLILTTTLEQLALFPKQFCAKISFLYF